MNSVKGQAREIIYNTGRLGSCVVQQPMSSELEFENQAFVELLSEDGLIILAR